jgi:hypothetical protein
MKSKYPEEIRFRWYDTILLRVLPPVSFIDQTFNSFLLRNQSGGEGEEKGVSEARPL